MPGLDFGQRNISYVLKSKKDTAYYTHEMKIESIFLDFPLLLKYKAARLNNYRPYLIGGASVRYDLASQKKIKEEEKPKIRLNPLDFYYELGFGIDFYLPYFKLSTELKLAVGLMNVLNRDNTEFTSSIGKMNSKLILLSFHFE